MPRAELRPTQEVVLGTDVASGSRPACEKAFGHRKEAMACLPNTLYDHQAVAPRAMYGSRREVECSLEFSAQYFLSELFLP